MNRQKQLQINSYVSALLLLLLFLLCAWLSNRYYFEADITRTGRHTLSETSLQILSEAYKPLEITAYARENPELRALIRKFVGRFQKIKPDIGLHFVNPDIVADEVRRLGITVNGELILRYQGRSEHVKTNSEQEFVNAVQRLLRGAERWLAFLEGHGERKPDAKANHDLGDWVIQLRDRGFKYQSLNIVEIGVIPDNTSVLVIASPQVSLAAAELSIIENYLEKGGNLLWLLEPDDPSGMDRIAEVLGIRVEPGTIIDPAGQLHQLNDPVIAITSPRIYPEHPITEDFDLIAYFPKATAISITPGSNWLSRPVLNTGINTWLELGKLEGEVGPDPGEQSGPLTLGLGLERQINQSQDQQQRVLIIGDGDFLSNTYVGNSGNLELGLRIINWLSGDDKLITIPSRTIEDAHIELSQFARVALVLGFVLILPLAFIACGFFLWWQRKKL